METNVSEAHNDVKGHVVLNIFHVEQRIVSPTPLFIRAFIGLAEKNVSKAQTSVRVHVVQDIFYVVHKIASGTQPSTEITTEPVGTNV